MENKSVDYQQVLGDLKSRRDRMNAAIAAVEHILGESQSGRYPEAPIKSGVYRKMTIKDASIHFLGSSGGSQTTSSIAHALKNGRIKSKSKSLYRSVYTILAAEAKKDSGQIVKAEDGWDLRDRQR